MLISFVRIAICGIGIATAALAPAVTNATSAAPVPKASSKSDVVVRPRPTPAPLRGRGISFTYESQITKQLLRRVEPVYSGPQASKSPALGVVQIYVDAATGAVIYAEVLDAPSKAHADALKRAVKQWRFARAVKGTTTVISSPVTYYFVSEKSGATRVERAL